MMETTVDEQGAALDTARPGPASEPGRGPAGLYVTYDGLLDPLGQSQVVPYLTGLAQQGWRLLVLSYEKAGRYRSEAHRELQRKLSRQGIAWYALRYHQWPSVLATGYDVARGIGVALWLALVHRVRFVHTRSYVASVIGWVLKRSLRVRFLFDMRGLWADERVDGRWWQPDSRLFKAAKWFERQFLLAADQVVVLTQGLRQELLRFPYLQGMAPARIAVIPTCVDLQLFSVPPSADQVDPQVAAAKHRRTYVYVGSIGTLYLLEEMAAFFRVAQARDPAAWFLLLVNGSSEIAHRALAAQQIDRNDYAVIQAPRERVPAYLAGAEPSVFFIRPCYSKIGSYPTKCGESLACGLPVITNRGCVDMDALIETERVGVILDAFSPQAYGEALRQLERLRAEEGFPARCRRAAAQHLSLERGISAYAGLYEACDHPSARRQKS